MVFEDDPQSDPYAHLIPGAKQDTLPVGDDPYAHLTAKKPETAKPKDKIGTAETLARALSRPFMGLQNEVEAGIEKLRGGSYTKARETAGERNAQAADESPWTTAAGEVAGNAATLPALMGAGALAKVPRLAQALKIPEAMEAMGEFVPAAANGLRGFLGRNVARPMAQGAAFGTAAGAINSDNPSLSARIQSAPFSAPVGAAGGLLMHGIGAGANRGMEALDNQAAQRSGGKFGMPYRLEDIQSRGEPGRVNRAIGKGLGTEAGEPSIQTYSDRIRQQDNHGQILPDLSSSARVMAGEAGSARDHRADAFRAQVRQRDIEAPARIRDQIDAGGKRDTRREVQDIAQQRGDESGFDETYRSLGAMKIGEHPIVKAFTRTPIGKTLLNRAFTEASNEPRVLPTVVKTTTEPVGPKTLMQPAVVDAPTQPAGVPRFKQDLINTMIERAPTQEKRDLYIKRAREEGAEEVAAPIAPVPKADTREVTGTAKVLDVSGLHYMLKDAKEMIRSGFSEHNVKLQTKDAENLRRFVNDIEANAVPDRLMEDMKRYSGMTTDIKSRDLGLGFRPYSTAQGPEGQTPDLARGEGVQRDTYGAKTGLHGLEDAHESLDPDRQAALAAGMRTKLRDEMGAVERTPGAGQRALQSFPKNEETDRWMKLLGDDESVNALQRLLERERNMSATARMMPEHGTKADPSALEGAVENATYTHSLDPTFIAARGLKGALLPKHWGRPKGGALADALSKPAETTLANALAGQRGQARTQQSIDAYGRQGLIAALGQWYR